MDLNDNRQQFCPDLCEFWPITHVSIWPISQSLQGLLIQFQLHWLANSCISNFDSGNLAEWVELNGEYDLQLDHYGSLPNFKQQDSTLVFLVP